MPVQRGPDLDDDFVVRDLLVRCPRGHPRHLPIEICFLIGRRHPRIHRRARSRASLADRLVHENQPTHSPGGYRQKSSAKPAIRSHARNTVALSPRRQIHTSVPTAHHRQLPTTQPATAGSPRGRWAELSRSRQGPLSGQSHATRDDPLGPNPAMAAPFRGPLYGGIP